MKRSIVLFTLALIWFGCSRSPVGPGSDPATNTARYKLADLDSLAGVYGNAPGLLSVTGRNVGTDGTAGTWLFQYADTSFPHTAYAFHCKSGVVGLDSSYPASVGSGFVSGSWFNSDSALGIAEENGGSEFRAQHPQSVILASLRDIAPHDRRTMWEISYMSNDSYSSLLVVRIDASSGEIIAKYE